MAAVPSPIDILLISPPYESYDLGKYDYLNVLRLYCFQGTIDTHCVECDRDSVFKSLTTGLRDASPSSRSIDVEEFINASSHEPITPNKMHLALRAYLPNLPNRLNGPLTLTEMEPVIRQNHVFEMAFECTRNKSHKYFYFFRVWNNTLSKVGQSPSIADLQTSDIRKYRKILGNESFLEFSRAIGLHAHGVGIGSLVYLRRIFETLIASSRAMASSVAGWDQELYLRSRMEDKILLLKEHLPNFLVENRSMYSILSKGIHELNEGECLKYFEPLKTGIELILDEKMSIKQREHKIAATAKSLVAIKQKISGDLGKKTT